MTKKYHIYKSEYDLEYYIDFNNENDMFWEIRQWCNNNINYAWQIVISSYDKCTIHYIFDTEIDYITFKLRWL